MPKDYTALPPNRLRRIDRAVDDEAWIVDLLQRAPLAALATVHDGQPFVNTNLFAYDPESHAIYLHTARTGRTRATVEANTRAGDERVCLSVSEMGRLLPAGRAFDFSVEYAGVAVFGRASMVADAAEAEHALQLLCDKYFPHLTPRADYRTPTPDELKRTSVYRIDIDSWSGKQKVADPDFPGAFFYGQPPEKEI